MPEYIYVPFEAPAPTAKACPTCEGAGVTGEQYGMAVDNGRTLLTDVFCPSCLGCGNGDPEHRECAPKAHANYHELDDYDDEPADEEGPVCPSCQGREWNAVQVFQGEGDNVEMTYTRTPCGCTESRAELLVAET